MDEITLHYSETLCREVARTFVLRYIRWRFVAALGVLIFLFIFQWADGDRSWFIGAMGSAIVFGLSIPILLFFTQHRGALSRFRRLRKPQSIFHHDEEGFRITADTGTFNSSWKDVTAVWRFPKFWLIFFSETQFLTIPLADLDNEAKETIMGRIHFYKIKVS